MDQNEEVIAQACPDQRGYLRVFAQTGDPAMLARVHFESCRNCCRILDALRLDPRPPTPPARPRIDPANDPVLMAKVVIAGVIMLLLIIMTFAGAHLFRAHGHRYLGLVYGTTMIFIFWRVAVWISDTTDAAIRAFRQTAPD